MNGDQLVPTEKLLSAYGVTSSQALREDNPLPKGDRLVSSLDLFKAYGITSYQTLRLWTKAKENPMPAPVSGGKGKGNHYKWLRSSLAEWEKKKFGSELAM